MYKYSIIMIGYTYPILMIRVCMCVKDTSTRVIIVFSIPCNELSKILIWLDRRVNLYVSLSCKPTCQISISLEIGYTSSVI